MLQGKWYQLLFLFIGFSLSGNGALAHGIFHTHEVTVPDKSVTSTTSLTKETIITRKKRTVESKVVSYQVFGKSYQVLNSSKNYEATGTASWYGRPFHHRYTSSGERYNMFQMTAAHKTLPLPTYLVVTNLVNGKEVIVKVNDRGPFVGNRLIDLSYAAAKKLGMVGLGVARVRIRALSHPFS